MERKLIRNGLIISILALTSILIVPTISKKYSASYFVAKTDKMVKLGAEELAPKDSSNKWDITQDAKIYLGKYNGTPIAFRVLKSNDGLLFLDCDSVLYKGSFSDNKKSDNKYINSNIYTKLDSYNFIKDEMNFSNVERGSIIYTWLKGKTDYDNNKYSDDAITSSNTSTFLLSYDEVSNLYKNKSSRVKYLINTSTSCPWWLRTQDRHDNGNSDKNGILVIDNNGQIKTIQPTDSSIGVSPAFNFNASNIAFTTALKHNKATKFELNNDVNVVKNERLVTLTYSTGFEATIDNSQIEQKGKITVDITNLGVIDSKAIQASDYSQISAMLVDSLNQVVAYGKISDNVAVGKITFNLPDGIAKGDYTLKVFAEKINSSDHNFVSDYASTMASMNVVVGESTSSARDININVNGTIAGINDPAIPSGKYDTSSPWTGSKVYFGSYGNVGPLLFRVLDANTTDYGEEPTMFLDCNNILKHQAFDNPTDSYYTDTATNVWAESDLRTWMNGRNNDEFLNKFSVVEYNSIVSSTRTSDLGLGDGTYYQGGASVKWTPVVNNKVFSLDGKELTNPAFGYTNTREASVNRQKEKVGYIGYENNWASNYWTRSEAKTSYGVKEVKEVAVVGENGLCFYGGPDKNGTYGASPALNLKLSSVLLSSAVGVDKNKDDLYKVTSSKVGSNTWNLTLLDDDKKIVLPKDEYAKLDDEDDDEDDVEVEIPFIYFESNTNDRKVNQISVMITDKNYKEDEVNVLYYGQLDVDDTLKSRSKLEGEFDLPANLPKTYKIYIMAEHVSAGNYIDFSSEPVEVNIVKEYKIKYKTKDGVFASKPKDTYTSGKEFPLPTNITRGDLQFADWFYDELCTRPVENNILPSSTKGDITVYARWAATITYNSQISYFTDDISDKTVATKDNILDIQDKYTYKSRKQIYYVGTAEKLYRDSPSNGMKLMNFDDNPLAVKTWEPWSYCFGWYVNNLGSSQGPFKEIGSITNNTYLAGYYPWTGNVTLQARYLGNIYHIYLHTNNKDMKINDPDWVQIKDTLWEKKYTDNKYNYDVGYEYRYRNNVYQLPSDDSVELKNGVFSGWYDNSECLGETVTATDRNTGDDKHYYASTLDIAPIVDDNEYTEQIGDSLVLYIYATGKIMFDSNGKPFDTVMTPAVEQRRKFSFYIELPEDTKNTFVWLSPTDKKLEMKKGNANVEHANYHAFFNIKPETEVLGWPCYIDSVADVVTGNVSNSSVNESTNNGKKNDKNNNGKKNDKNNNGKKHNSANNSSSSNTLKGLNGLDMEIHTLNGTGKKKVTFTCPSDAKLMNFIGANGSKVLYLHVATAGGKYSIYKVNLVNKVMFELH